MRRKRKLKTIVRVDRSGSDVIITSDNDFYWKVDGIRPEVAMTAIIAQTLCASMDYEAAISREYIIELKIEHKRDE